MTSTRERFLAALTEIRWFHAIGQPLQESGVVRLSSINDWPGPEDDRVEAFFSIQQSLHDELESFFGQQRSEYVALWDEIRRRVFETAGPIIGYDPEEDTWHGPTAATWHAAWTAGLVAWCQALNHPVPDWLEQQWSWFKRGRWPAGFATLNANRVGKGCLVL